MAARSHPSSTQTTTIDGHRLPTSSVERASWLEDVLVETFHMDPDDARMTCGIVIEQFGDRQEVNDDILPTQIRSIFYTLESKRILTFRRIEYKGEEGETRRGFFWRLNLARIAEVRAQARDGEDANVYEGLPQDCWKRSAS